MAEIRCSTGGSGSPPTDNAGALLTVTNSAVVALPAGVDTVLPMTSTVQTADPCGVFTASSSGVTVSQDGHYSVVSQIRPARSGGALPTISSSLKLNTTTVITDDMHAVAGSASVVEAGGSVTLRPGWTGWLNAGDKVSVWARVTGAAGQIEVEPLENQLSLVWLGDNQDNQSGGVWA